MCRVCCCLFVSDVSCLWLVVACLSLLLNVVTVVRSGSSLFVACCVLFVVC